MTTRTLTSLGVIAVAILLNLAAPQSAHADVQSDAGKYIDKLGNQALDIIGEKGLTRDQKQRKLEKLFSTNVDIPWVGRFVLGRFWKQATEDQKKRYLKNYEHFLVRHYTSRFADYTGGTFNLTDTKETGDMEYEVSMELLSGRPNDPPILVDYHVRKDKSGFKIFDIIVEGVSLITTQRSEFASVVSNHDVEYLIKQLENKSLPVSR